MLNLMKLIAVCGIIFGLAACSQDTAMPVDTGAISSDAPTGKL